jgi:hypothetical protein
MALRLSKAAFYRRRPWRWCHHPSRRAERESKPTAADVTRAIIIFRNVLIPRGCRPLRDSFSSEIISTMGGGSQKKPGWGGPYGDTHPRPHRAPVLRFGQTSGPCKNCLRWPSIRVRAMEGCAVLRFSRDSQGRARAREPHRNESGRADFSSKSFYGVALCPGIVLFLSRCPCPDGGRQKRYEMPGIILGTSLNRNAIRRNGDWPSRC